MPLQNETPPIGATGLAKIVPDENIREIAPNSAPAQAQIPRNPRAVRAARRQLNLEFLHECAGGIRIWRDANCYVEIWLEKDR